MSDKLIDPDMPICRVDGCDARSRYRIKRLCQKHYQRLRNHGGTDDPRPTLEERLYSRIEVDINGCWIWQGALSSEGYGRLGHDGRDVYTHRLSWQLANGDIPADEEIDHLCRVRACCNPEHLEPVVRRVNFLRGQHPTAVTVATDVCRRGHSMADAYMRRSGKRTCRKCSQEAMRRRRKEKRNASTS